MYKFKYLLQLTLTSIPQSHVSVSNCDMRKYSIRIVLKLLILCAQHGIPNVNRSKN